MVNIVVLGATGFVGTELVAEAARRKHRVAGVSRTVPPEGLAGVRHISSDVEDATALGDAIRGADVVVASLSPRHMGAERFIGAMESVGRAAADIGARLIVVGGAGAMRQGEGGPRVADELPAPIAAMIPADVLEGEVRPVAAVADWLEQSAPASLDWLYVSPPFDFRPSSGTRPTGEYRVESPVARFDASLAVGDFAVAVLDEIERRHHRGHIAVRALSD